MNAALSHVERQPAPMPVDGLFQDHRERHRANACEWHRRYLACLRGECEPGTEAQALWNAMLHECKLGNLDVAHIAGQVAVFE